MNIIKEILYRIRGEYTTEKLISMGMKVGQNFGRLHGVILDPSHCWLIEIGDNVTMAPRVHVLCHDASTKVHLGYTDYCQDRRIPTETERANEICTML